MTYPNHPEPKVRKQRAKAMTESGRQILQRERQRMNREQAAIGERMVEEAKRLREMQDLNKHSTWHRDMPKRNAVQRGMVRRIATVLRSEGVNAIYDVEPGSLSAWTDYERIFVRYPEHDDPRLLAATLRGIAYHEGGHIRWTQPFVDLRAEMKVAGVIGDLTGAELRRYHSAWNALEDQRMETAVTSDSPRKSAYLTTMILTSFTQTPEMAAANYPLLIWRRYLPQRVRRAARKAFIEMHGANGKALAQAFEKVTTKYVTATDSRTMWDAVVEAADLFDQHNTAFDLTDAGHKRQGTRDNERREVIVIPIDPEMLNEMMEDAEEVEDDGEGPIVVFVPNKPMDQPETGDETDDESDDDGVPVPMPSTGSTDDDDEDEDNEDEDNEDDESFDIQMPPMPQSPQSDEDDEDDDDDGGGVSQPDTSEDDESDDEADDEADADDEDDSEPETDDGGDSAGVGGGDHDNAPEYEMTQEALDAEREEAMNEMLNDSALDGDVEAYKEAIRNPSSALAPYNAGVSTNTELQAAAIHLAERIEDSFREATMDYQPAWVEQQRRGVLNVGRYVTRNPGETEVFKQWTDDDQPGYNIAISVMLDYSGSMGGSMEALAQSALAMKMAGDKLGIPTTITLWDDSAEILYDRDDEPTQLPLIRSAGGTDPSMALSDLDNQRFDKELHIVMIMTDGQWGSVWEKERTLAAYVTEGRTLIAFGYDEYQPTADRYAEALRRYGAPYAYGISNLMDIPKVLERTILDMV